MDGPRHRAAVVALHEGRLLVIRRVKEGRRYAVLPGGGVEPGESAADAALRELREETSLAGVIDGHLGTLQHESGPADYYLVTVPAGPMIISGPEAQRRSAGNTYEPVWIGVDELAAANLQPESIRSLIARLAPTVAVRTEEDRRSVRRRR